MGTDTEQMTADDAAEFEAFRTAFDAGEPEVAAPAPAPKADAPPAAPTPPAAPAAPAPPAAPNSGEPVHDPFAGLPQEVKDMLAEVPRLRSMVDAQGQELNRWKGQTSTLQSKLDKIATQTPSAAPRPKRDALRSTLPEIAAALDEVDPIEAPSPPAAPAAPTPPAPTPVAAPSQPETTSDLRANEMALDLARPTWFKDLESTDFKLYAATLPRAKQDEIMRTDDARVIMGALNDFDGYKTRVASAKETDAQRARRIAAGLTPQGDGRRPGKNPDAGLTPEQIEQQAMDAAFKADRRSP